MKTKQFALVFLAIAFTVSAAATEIPKMNIIVLDDSKALVAAATTPHAAAEISIISEAGEMVYYKRSKASAEFKSVLDLSELNDGMYTVKLKTGKSSVVRNVAINHGKVEVSPIKPQLDPYFSYDGDMVKLTYLNFKEDNVSMLVYNGSHLVFESKLGKDFNICKAFDVSNMVKGEFDFILTAAGKNYAYKIKR